MNQFRLTTPHSLKEQRDKGVRLGEVFSMSHLYFKYYNILCSKNKVKELGMKCKSFRAD